MEALVIVHLSSLDAYTWENGVKAGRKLAASIAGAIVGHDGPVYIVDQGWLLRPAKETEPRKIVLRAVRQVQLMKDIHWVRFNEDEQDWDRFLKEFSERLEDDGVESVVIGGVWYDPRLETGCATDVALYLRELMPVEVDESIVGCVPV